MIKAEAAYNQWAEQYDSNQNKTRDLEAQALRKELSSLPSIRHCLEMGCGAGKNTVWLAQQATNVTAIDLTDAMLQVAKEKVKAANVRFIQANMLHPWAFAGDNYDLITFSLVLEHIELLTPVFEKAAAVLQPGGFLYLGELHPYKQYAGSKARFETEDGTQVVECHTHHLSDYIAAANASGLQLQRIGEYFDDSDRNLSPRILTLLFQKPV